MSQPHPVGSCARILRLEHEVERSCRHCRELFRTIWRPKHYCNTCVAELTGRAPQPVHAYLPPPSVRAFGLRPVVKTALEGPASLLVLAGPTGSGKTTQAHLALAARRVAARFVASGDLGRAEDRAAMELVPWLAIDDVGRRVTPGIIDALCELLDRRAEHQRRTIVTTNLPRKQLDELDERLGSRMASAQWVILDGPDLRRQQP